MAEREGFEPSVPRKGYKRFPGVPDRPLRHLSNKLFSHPKFGRDYHEPFRCRVGTGFFTATFATRNSLTEVPVDVPDHPIVFFARGFLPTS